MQSLVVHHKSCVLTKTMRLIWHTTHIVRPQTNQTVFRCLLRILTKQHNWKSKCPTARHVKINRMEVKNKCKRRMDRKELGEVKKDWMTLNLDHEKDNDMNLCKYVMWCSWNLSRRSKAGKVCMNWNRKQLHCLHLQAVNYSLLESLLLSWAPLLAWCCCQWKQQWFSKEKAIKLAHTPFWKMISYKISSVLLFNSNVLTGWPGRSTIFL